MRMEKLLWFPLHPRLRSLVLVTGLVTLGSLPASGLPRIPYIAFIGPARSPLVKDLAEFGSVVRPRDPRANILVVDGDAYSGTMAEEEAIRKGWKAGKGLLILDADEDDLKGDLIRLTGVVPSKGMAAVYLHHRRDGDIDQVQLPDSHSLIGHAGRLARQAFLRHVGEALREELQVPGHRSPRALVAKDDSNDLSNTPHLPTNNIVQTLPFFLEPLVSTGLNDYWMFVGLISLPPGTATLDFGDSITVVGNGRCQDNSAAALISYNGYGNSSVQSFPTFPIDAVDLPGFDYTVSGYANPQHQRVIGLTLDQGTPTLAEALPADAVGVETVSSQWTVQFGGSASGPTGALSYQIGQSTPLSGWTVNQTFGSDNQNPITWVYQEQLDANNNNMDALYSALFAGAPWPIPMPNFGVYTPSELATSEVQSAPAVVWELCESSNAQVATITSDMIASNTFWVRRDPVVFGTSDDEWFLGSYNMGAQNPDLIFESDQDVTVQLTDLWNQMGHLSSLQVPTTVQGNAQFFPVTVTLDHPAPLNNMPVTLTSSANIIAGQVLTVPAGQTTFTFQINVTRPRTSLPVVLTATVNGASITQSLTVLP